MHNKFLIKILMNLLKITLLILFASILLGCGNSGEHSDATHKTDDKSTGVFTAEMSVSPTSVVSGQPVKLIFRIKDPKGETYSDLELDHEKNMHLYIVSDDLSQFNHEHPVKNADGTFEHTFTFPNGGQYKIYIDFKPKNAEKRFESYDLNVSGEVRAKVEVKPDDKFEKTVEDLRVTMKPDGDLIAGKELMLTFQVFDSKTNKPVTDLEDYLGAKAHFVVISKDLKDFVHVHPMSNDNAKGKEDSHGEHNEKPTDEKLAGKDSESIVAAMLTFPKEGVYKIFAQFKQNDKITVVPFVFEVKQGEADKPVDLSNVTFPEGSYKIIVSKNGFTPQEISYKADKPLKLAFYRADEENCGDEIVFKDLNIKKKLPVGEVVLVDIPTDKKGEFNFSCDNDKLKGKIIIQ